MGKLKFLITLPKGEGSKNLYDKIKEDDKTFGRVNLGFTDFYSNEIRGSTPLRSGQLNRLIQNSKMRVAVPSDNSNGRIYRLIKEKYSTEFNALVVYGNAPSYKRNFHIWENVIKLAKERKNCIEFPFMVQGFYTSYDRNEPEYGSKIIPASNFKVIEDERLSAKYGGRKFNTFDKIGLPPIEELEENSGQLVFRTRTDGVAGMNLSGGGLFCDSVFLSDFPCEDPNVHGRMILVED